MSEASFVATALKDDSKFQSIIVSLSVVQVASGVWAVEKRLESGVIDCRHQLACIQCPVITNVAFVYGGRPCVSCKRDKPTLKLKSQSAFHFQFEILVEIENSPANCLTRLHANIRVSSGHELNKIVILYDRKR